jgi:HK97 family phage major capsid protein
MTEQEMQAKIETINAANNKIISDYQAENERNLKGLVTDSAFKDLKGTFEKRWAEVDVELAKLKVPQFKTAGIEPTLHTKAYGKYLRKQILTPDEQKILQIGQPTYAGVLAPPEYADKLLHYAYVQHPFRQVANIRKTDQERVYLHTNDAYGVATWEAELATKTETTGLTYARTTVIPQEMKVLYKATQKMLEDSMFDLEAEIAYAAGRAFGNLESTAFYSGNGTTTGPYGISVDATIVADHTDVNTDNTIAFEDLIDVQYLLEEPYIAHASWLMNRSLLGVIVGLKSAATPVYLLQPNLQAGQPPLILGSPVYTWSAMPAVVAAAGGDTIPGTGGIYLLYGDFRQAYTIVDRVGITIQRLNELYAADGEIGFYVRARVGGAVVIPPAVQMLCNIA